MKNLLIMAISTLLISSCSSTYKQIGRLNMVSNRNVNPEGKYKLITTYSGSSEREILKSRHNSIEEAVDATVRSVQGGEFLTNVKIYLVDNTYFCVVGDVYGAVDPKEVTYRGFKIGDNVRWKYGDRNYTGTIVGWIDAETCTVEDEKGKFLEKDFDTLSVILKK